jgi:hypothetical protein
MHLNHCAIAIALSGLLLGGCGDPAPAPGVGTGPGIEAEVLPADPTERAMHCYLVLTLTIEQMREVDGPGQQAGFVGRRGADELLRARTRISAELDEDQLDELRRNLEPRLDALLSEFDHDGDGELATAAEIEEFNRHVTVCSRPWGS